MLHPPSPIEVFLSYAPEDAPLFLELEKHLSVLLREGLIRSFHAGVISPGQDWEAAVDEHLARADLILLLVSVDFLASPRCAFESDHALRRLTAGRAQVFPVILRDCDFHDAPFGKLKALPKNGRPVKSWADENEAFADVARGIREIVSKVLSARAPSSLRPSRPPPPGARSRADAVREVLQTLALPDCVGVALLAPFGFYRHQIAGEVLHQLKRPDEPLLAVRLVPELKPTTEESFYHRLLRDLRRAIPEAWRSFVDGRKDARAMDRFEFAVEELLDGPAQEASRKLILAVDGLAAMPLSQLEQWGFLMARLSGQGLKLLVWGGQELHDLRTRPAADGRFSMFHLLRGVSLGPLLLEEVADLVADRGGAQAAASVIYEETRGHPALVHELLDRHPEDARAGRQDAIVARILSCDHLARLRRTVEADPAAQEVLRGFAGVSQRPLPRGRAPAEERLSWLGVIKDVGPSRWDWTAPAMQRFASEWR
jgi:hypothetical protein